MSITRRSLEIMFLIAIFIVCLTGPRTSVFAEQVQVSGTTITVTTTADEYDSTPNDQCSLREAITAANTDAAYGGCIGGSGVDTIMLEAGTYTLSIVGPYNDTNNRGDLDILADVSIIGTGSSETIVDGDLALDRVFDVTTTAEVIFESMKITNGAAPAWHISGDGEDGGGIRSSGNVTLIDVVLINNHAGNGMDEFGDGGDGGGIYCLGDLTITESIIQGNHAGDGGNNTLTPNKIAGPGGHGGGVYSYGSLIVLESTIQNNYAGNGGNTTTTISYSGPGGNGGGIMAAGDAHIENSLIMGNRAGNSGNGVIGQQSYVGQGGDGGGIFGSEIKNIGIDGSEIRANYGGNMGTGPAPNEHTGGRGGGIFNYGTIVISTTTLSFNRPGNGYKNNIGANLTYAGAGGALYNNFGATAVILGAGIHDNSGAIAGLHPRGGGVFNGGNLIIGNTTIAKNQEPYEGGGIYNDSGGTVTINSSTIAYNRSQYGGGIFNVAGGSVIFMNTILAWNVGWQGGKDCNGVITSNGYNLVMWASDAECTIDGDMTGVIEDDYPLISWDNELDFYGGETKTLIPETGSPVIDAGNPAVPGSGGNACLQNDQRGVTRPQSAACDIGAVEATPQFTVTKTVDDASTYPGQLITYSITVTNIGAFDAANAYVYDQLPDGLIFAGPVVLDPVHPEAAVAANAGDIPFVVTGLDLASGQSVVVTLPVVTDVNYPGGEIITNTALAFTAIPQTEGSDFINIKTGWRVMLPLIMR